MVANPSWGLKLTGKEGANSLGVFIARDEVTALIFPGSESSSSTSLDKANTATAFRYRRDIWNNSTIGFTMNDREGGDYFNRVLGVDANIRLSNTDSFDFSIGASRTRYDSETAEEYGQPGGEFGDRNLSFRYFHSTRNWDAFFFFDDVGDGYRTDMDHRTRVGFRRYSFRGERTWYGDRLKSRTDHLWKARWYLELIWTDRGSPTSRTA